MPTTINYVPTHRGIKIAEVSYGTFVTNVPSHPSAIYIKVDKNRCSDGLTLTFKRNVSVLLNIKSGTLRDVPGSQEITVLEADITLVRLSGNEVKEYLKDRR